MRQTNGVAVLLRDVLRRGRDGARDSEGRSRMLDESFDFGLPLALDGIEL